MKELAAYCPQAPDWSLDWQGLDASFAWVRALAGCEQDPVWHAEGDVWTHTRMVLEELSALAAWRALPEFERLGVFLACLLHDVEKPSTTRTVDGRITARNHSKKGAVRARRLLWELGAPFELRELVCHLVLHHQVPFWCATRPDGERLASLVSWTARCDLLALVTEADGRGRRTADQQELLDQIELFRALCEELDCLQSERPFPSPAQRVAWFRDPTRQPDSPVPPRPHCTVTVLSGLPAAGKDHWVERHGAGLPVVSPDALRAQLGIAPTANQGAVVQAARERAREHLRAGRDFVWNATNLSRPLRAQVLDLIHAYGARARLVVVECAHADWVARNRSRTAPIPQRSLERMLARWQTPDRSEAEERLVVGEPQR